MSDEIKIETRFTPSIAKHYGNRALSLTGKVQSLRDDLTANGCSNPEVLELLQQAQSATAGLQLAILAASQGGRINPVGQLEERIAKEAAKAAKKAARAAAKASAAQQVA